MPVTSTNSIPFGDDAPVDEAAAASKMGVATNVNPTGFSGATSGGFGSSSGFGSNPGFGAPASGFGSAPSSGFGASGFGSTPSAGGFGNAAGAPQQNLTAGAAATAAGGADTLIENTNKDWINNKWRPAMGWLYMMTCFFDFVIFPILWSLLQALSKGAVTNQWQPLTLQGAGLYHIAMGAVLGIAAYGRTKEKLEQKQ